ncbi:uncharacterized protein LOC144945060 [Lampetra fluviatilis]
MWPSRSVPRPFISPPALLVSLLSIAVAPFGGGVGVVRAASASSRGRAGGAPRGHRGGGGGPRQQARPLPPTGPAWCETRNITQIVSHAGCASREIDNRVCLGQCYSYSVPDTLPQTSESLLHCDSCTPSDTTWDVVTLQCGDDYSDGGDADDDGAEGSPEVTKLVEKILRCECQACGAQQHLLLAAHRSGGGEAHGADPLLSLHGRIGGSAGAGGGGGIGGGGERSPAPRRGLSHDPEPGAAHGDDSEAGPRQPARGGRAVRAAGFSRGGGTTAPGGRVRGRRRRSGGLHPGGSGSIRTTSGTGSTTRAATTGTVAVAVPRKTPDRLAAGLWGGENYRGGL